MKHLLDTLFCFPPDAVADRQFVQRFLDILRLTILVVDRKVRPQFTNLKYDTDIAMYTAKLSGATRRKHMRIFAALIEPHVVRCLEHGQTELIRGLKLPVSKQIQVDVAICPGQIQGSELAFVIGLAPRRAAQLSKDAVLRTIIESTDAALIFFDASLRIGLVNSGACDLFRQREEDLVGKRASEVNLSEQGRVLDQQIDYLMTSRTASLEEAYPLASAKRGVIQMMLAVWPLVDGDVPSGVVMAGKPLPARAVAVPEEDWRLVLGKTVDDLGPPSFFTHVDGRVVFMTRTAQPLVARLTDKKGINIIKDIPWTDPRAVQGLYAAVSRGTEFLTLLATVETGEGRKHFRLTAYGLRDVGDIVSQVFLLIHDVSEIENYRKMMAETTKGLATEKELLERAIDTLDLPYGIVDRDLIMHRTNWAHARRLGTTPALLAGKRLDEAIPSAHESGLVEHVRTALDRQTSVYVPTFHHIMRDGRRTPVSLSIFPFAVDGRSAAIIVAREHSEQERLGQLAARWAQLYEAVASSTGDGIIVSDKKGMLVDFNPVVTKLLGDKKQWIGRSSENLVTISENDLLRSFAEKALATGKPVRTGTVKVTRAPKGEPVFMDITFVPLTDAQGGPDGLVSVVHYSTVIKDLEEKIRKYTKNLEEIVDKRTQELASANATLAQSVERISSLASWGTTLSVLRDTDAVLDAFLNQARGVLGADFVSLALARRIDGTARTAYHTSGRTPPPGAIPPEVVEETTAKLVPGGGIRSAVKLVGSSVLTADMALPDARGLLVAWKEKGDFGPLEVSLASLLSSRLAVALPITTYLADLRKERDRAECLRRIAVRVAGASSVGQAVRIVAEELAEVVPADQFLWMVHSSGEEVWLSEVYNRRGGPMSDAKPTRLEELDQVGAVFSSDKGHPREYCERFRFLEVAGLQGGERPARPHACPFAGRSADGRTGKLVRELLEGAGFVPTASGSFACAPVVLAEGSWGLMCAYGEAGASISSDDACFVCLAASTVQYVWQAADAASALRRFEVAGETVTDLAHDLKYPLMRITENLSRLGGDDKSTPCDSAAVSDIKGEVKKLAALASELTQVSNPRSRAPEIVDLKETLAYCLSLASGDLATRAITVANEMGDVPPAFADRKDIVKIVLSILANSLDAVGKSGSIRVTSTVLETKPGVRQVGLVFEDSGPGVPEGEIAKVFDAFYTTKEGGTGLGLFSAKKRARANGGDLVCEVGQGGKTRFVVLLPVGAA